jgi:hypothetical protein
MRRRRRLEHDVEVRSWHSDAMRSTTGAARSRRFPCDDVLPEPEQALYRAVTVDAPPPIVFRWLCQLKLALEFAADRPICTGDG